MPAESTLAESKNKTCVDTNDKLMTALLYKNRQFREAPYERERLEVMDGSLVTGM